MVTCNFVYYLGMTESLYSDLIQHSKLAMDCRFSVLGQNDFMQQLEGFVMKGNVHGESESHPVLVHGGPGMGKTALMAVLAANVFSLDKWKVCLFYFRALI